MYCIVQSPPFLFFAKDILMHLEVLQYFSCCFAFIQEHREEIFVYFDRSVILALSKLRGKNLGKPPYRTLPYSLSLYIYIKRKYFICLNEEMRCAAIETLFITLYTRKAHVRRRQTSTEQDHLAYHFHLPYCKNPIYNTDNICFSFIFTVIQC